MRGGQRKGAGRKPSPKGPKGSVTLWLSSDVAAFLETFGKDRSELVDDMVRRSAAFKAFQKTSQQDARQ